MSNDLIPIKAIIDPHREEIATRLPKHLGYSPEQFFQLCYAIDRNPKLAQVARNNPQSLINAVLRAADCGLLIGSAYDHCWLIPYGNDIQFQIGYRGMVYLLYRAGAIVKSSAACVYEGDFFDIELGDREHLIHKPNLKDEHRRDDRWLKDKKNIVGAYAVAWLPAPLPGERTAMTIHRWVPLGEIEAARKRSKVPDGPAWTNDYPAMGSKTATRRLCKLIEVCGPTEENKEAWERFGKTIELDNQSYHNMNDETDAAEVDDYPKGGGSTPRSSRPGGGEESAEHTPPPQDGGRKKERPAATTPPPPKKAAPPPPEPEEPIPLARQYELMDKATMAGLKTQEFYEYVESKYGLNNLKVTPTQAAEIEKYLNERGAA